MGEGVSKIARKVLTYLMDGPKTRKLFVCFSPTSYDALRMSRSLKNRLSEFLLNVALGRSDFTRAITHFFPMPLKLSKSQFPLQNWRNSLHGIKVSKQASVGNSPSLLDTKSFLRKVALPIFINKKSKGRIYFKCTQKI